MIRVRIRLGWLCLVTLPIFVIVTVVLIFSFFVADGWGYTPQDLLILRGFELNRGRIIYSQMLGKYYADDGSRGWQHEMFAAHPMAWVDQTSGFTTAITFLGFALRDQNETGFRVIAVPLWPIVVISAIPTLLWIRARRSAKRLPGHCRHCGYDLRASKDRCPECGTPIPTTNPAPSASANSQ